MTNLVATLALVLQTLTPKIAADRVRNIASDMIEVVEAESNSDKRLDSKTHLAMLAAAAVGESGLRESVENCKTSGDGGKSIGLGQVMRGPNWEGHDRKEICTNRKLQLKLALHVIKKCNTKTRDAKAVFQCYTSGNPTTKSHAANEEYSIFRKIKESIDAAAREAEDNLNMTPNTMIFTSSGVVLQHRQ